jgi:cysteinyl-tRNA synthetase
VNTAAAIADLLERASAKRHQFSEIEQLLQDCLFLGIVRRDFCLLFAPPVMANRDDSGKSILGGTKIASAFDQVRKTRASISNRNPEELREIQNGLAEQGIKLEIREFGNIRIAPTDPEQRDKESQLIETLIAARVAARKVKNFAEADRIRDELAAIGVVIRDSKNGTTWEVKR